MAEFRQFEGRAQISGSVPSAAVPGGGEVWRALSEVGQGLSARLGQMADEAKAKADEQAAKSGSLQGRSVGAAAAESYLAKVTSDDVAQARAANLPVEIDAQIRNAAAKYGVSADTLRMIASLESKGDGKAKNPTSSAGGLFQFTDATAAQYGLTDRFDTGASSEAAAHLLSDNAAALRKALGREPTPAELYLAHQQGAGGSIALLTNPNAIASDVVGMDAVTLNGGKAGMTAGDFASLWMAKAGQGGAASGAPAAPAYPLSETPLALRRDGTPAGEAFDKAAMEAYSWRVVLGMETDLGQAAIENADNPAGYEQAAAKIKAKYAGAFGSGDRELDDFFAENFAKRTAADRLQISAAYETKLRQDVFTTATSGLDTLKGSLERHAYNLGANPQGSEMIQDELGRATTAIDGLVRDGVLSLEQSVAYKRQFGETAYRAQTQGTFDSLSTPAEKQQFAMQILDDYAKGQGPFGILDLADVQNLSGTLYRKATEDQNRLTADAYAERARVNALLEDDLLSMQTTGKGISFAENNLDAETVKAVLGEANYQDYVGKRATAAKGWEAMSGMETQSRQDIADRLKVLTPTPGVAGYAEKQAIFEAATKQADAILEARKADPATYVYQNFPAIQQAWTDAYSTGTPTAFRGAIAQTLHVQAELGIETPQPLPKPVAQGAVERFTSINATGPAAAGAAAEGKPILASEEDRIDAITSLVFGTDDAGQQGMVFEQLVRTGLDPTVSGALLAFGRGDTEGARRLFRAVMTKPDEIPGEIPESVQSINEAIQRRLMSPGQIGDFYYGLSDGSADSYVVAERDTKLMLKSVQLRLLSGESLDAAVDGVGKDLFGNLVPVRGNGEVNAQILLPQGESSAPYLAGLSDLKGTVRSAMTAQMEIPGIVDPDPSTAVEPGNIDLFTRPVVQNGDGTISTVRSMSFEDDGAEVLVPTVAPDGKLLTDDEAIAQYRRSGQHLGKFASAADATAYAEALHRQQEALYDRSTGQSAVIGAVKSNYIESVMQEGYFRDVAGGFVFIDPYTGTAIASADGRPLIFGSADVLARGQGVLSERASAPTDQDRERMWLEQQSSSFGMMGGGVAP